MSKIRIGVIGLGFGRHHVRTLANMEDAQVVAVADRSPKLLGAPDVPGGIEAYAASYGARAYRDAMTFEKVSDILLSETGTKFDRRAVSALINFLENRDGKTKWAHYREKPKEAVEEDF